MKATNSDMSVDDLIHYVKHLVAEDREELYDEGLRVDESPMPGGYDSSPKGYLAFASTGGDGVHFSVPDGAAGPVIMTVPMAFDNPNFVVGSDIKEFLSLGSAYGYFSLEQLAYNWERTVEAIAAAQEPSAALQKLSERFDLRPWLSVGVRLRELEPSLPIKSADA
ncbi:hypothetical protein ACN9MY_28335 [Pseudoduganella sp. R-31]|jgi:hypothetical protein|uniref:hypothetical protein n=1 Tax=Pseudoduganella sp. R-31 TaxID=3404060 RepID=UPI003CEB48FB